jgi:CHASE2 domain-containing sensor protein
MNWQQWFRQYSGVIAICSLVFSLVVGLRLSGKITAEEFKIYDWMLHQRKLPDLDERIVIVGITDSDIKQYQVYPFTDQLYAELFEKIKRQKPRVIGFDIIRDLPVNPGHEQLVKQYKTTPNLIGVGLFFGEEIAAPPVLEQQQQVGDIAVILDPDGVVRRSFLLTPGKSSNRGFALEVVRRYLSEDKSQLKLSQDGQFLELGKAKFVRFQGRDGAYLGVKDYGFQFLIDYRYSSGQFRHVSLTEVLQNQIPEHLFRDRIVLIGPTAKTLKDEFLSPYSQQEASRRHYGVEIQANMVAQLLDATTKGTSIIKSLSEPWDYIIILVFLIGTTICLWSWRYFSLDHPRIFILISIVFLVIINVVILAISFLAFIQGTFWIPPVSTLMAIWLGGIITTIHVMVWKGIKITENYSQKLAQKLAQRTQELQVAQAQLLAQERLAFIGQLESGINHEYGNILSSLSRNLESCLALEQNLLQLVSANYQEHLNLGETCQEVREILVDYLQPCHQSMQKVLANFQQVREQFLPVDLHDSRRAHYQEINLIDLLMNCYKITCRTSLKHLTPQLQTDFASEQIKCYVVPSELNYVITNLLNNAWDALEEKKTQQIADYQPKISLSVAKIKSNLEITIADNGIGVTPEITEQIFQIFYTTKPMGKGTGIGLTFSRDIIVGRYQGDLILKLEHPWTKFVIIFPDKLPPTSAVY